MKMLDSSIVMNAIGHIRSEFRQKFGVPKQPGLAPALKAVITLKSEWAHESALRGLEECSHLWVIFQFHMNAAFSGATVRPPLLGGEKRMGVFATRSPHRPNPLGLSLVKIESVEIVDGEAQIQVSGHDFVDGTPVLDLKPFVSSYDVPHDKSFHWSDHVKTTALPVQWTERARQVSGDKVEAITQVLQLDPRPRNAKAESRFGLSFAGLNVVFVWNGAELLVEEVTPESASSHIK